MGEGRRSKINDFDLLAARQKLLHEDASNKPGAAGHDMHGRTNCCAYLKVFFGGWGFVFCLVVSVLGCWFFWLCVVGVVVCLCGSFLCLFVVVGLVVLGSYTFASFGSCFLYLFVFCIFYVYNIIFLYRN